MIQDIFKDGRFLIGNYYEVRADSGSDLSLCYAYNNNDIGGDPICAHYGVLYDKSDGELFRYVRGLGISLPWWKREAKDQYLDITHEVIIDETAMMALMLAF